MLAGYTICVFDLDTVRQQFPLLARTFRGQRLAYLDNAATTQKPLAMLEALTGYYTQHNANVHRGVHTLGDESTQAYHAARQTIADFFAAREEELILTRNTTEALNLIALGWGRQHLQAGDVMVSTVLEHHSNLVPWQEVARSVGARLLVLPVTPAGSIDYDAAESALRAVSGRVRLLAVTLVSNATGALTDIDRLTRVLRERGQREECLVVVDAAQAAARLPVSLGQLGADALAVSAHKMYGPMGMGALIMRRECLESMQPVLTGGGMIGEVGEQSATFAESLIDRFAAGTPDVAGAVAWAAALTWLRGLGWDAIAAHEQDVLGYAWEQLSSRADLELIGPSPLTDKRWGSVAFRHKSVHAHDVAQILDRYAVMVRSGHHCTMPLHVAQHWVATTRASFAVYSGRDDVDALMRGLDGVGAVFRE